MKLGIAGAGKIVNMLFECIHDLPEFELEAIASTPKSLEKVTAFAKEHGIKKAYPDYNALLSDDAIEVMYIASPNHLHYEMSKQALLAGKHVICEKPFTSNAKELEELMNLANEKGLILTEAITTQYLPNILKMKELLPRLGNIKLVCANFSQYSSRYDAFKRGEILPAFDVTKSGGALMDINIYNAHFVAGLFGAPNEVHYHANIERGIDTSGILTLNYDHFKASLVGAKDCKAPLSVTVQGDLGCLISTSAPGVAKDFKLVLNDGSEEYYDLQGDTNRMAYEFKEFAKMIETKDFTKANEMLAISLTVMKIATEARKDAGIVFPAD
ncbi:MAG: Gfo/Idh/MocA family oxidoreductase [Erysipelotrichaceae bacterium]|nr:Gfo/Idh/MocA family oxidoreductase [Erysipelotrichaceae bacterium]